jgi:peptidoglycan endopeptidase LytF
MCPLGTFTHTIRYGESLWIISNMYNTTVDAIMAVNPGIDPYNLRIGQIICIPMMNTPFGR